MITLLDSVTPGAFGRLASTSPDALAGYDDGLYNDIRQIERDYPAHRHVSIAVFARDDADCLDIETGDARPHDAPGWVRRQQARGHARPWLYANESTWPAVQEALVAAGIGRKEVVKWRAKYDGIAELEPDDDGKQYTDHWEGRNVDASVFRDNVFDLPRPRPKRKRKPILKRVTRRAVRHAKPHPKVVAGGTGGGLGIGILHLLTAFGVHVTPTEAAGISTLVGVLLGYLAPTATPQTNRPR